MSYLSREWVHVRFSTLVYHMHTRYTYHTACTCTVRFNHNCNVWYSTVHGLRGAFTVSFGNTYRLVSDQLFNCDPIKNCYQIYATISDTSDQSSGDQRSDQLFYFDQTWYTVLVYLNYMYTWYTVYSYVHMGAEIDHFDCLFCKMYTLIWSQFFTPSTAISDTSDQISSDTAISDQILLIAIDRRLKKLRSHKPAFCTFIWMAILAQVCIYF